MGADQGLEVSLMDLLDYQVEVEEGVAPSPSDVENGMQGQLVKMD